MQKWRWLRDSPGGHVSTDMPGNNYNGWGELRLGLKKTSRKKQRRQKKKIIDEWISLHLETEALCPYCHNYCNDELACADEYDRMIASELMLMAQYDDEWERQQEREQEAHYYEALCDPDTTWNDDPFFDEDWDH